MAKPENRKPQPISRHPLFPAIVALWFAALFGLGSLIVSPALIERIVSAAGIDKVLPMAAPPLGTTARILFALALTGLGGLVGLVAGRRVAQTAEEAPARMPFAGLEADEIAAEPEAELADEPARPALPRRRRAFALVAEDAAPLAAEEEAPAEAPEAEQPPILNLSELDLQSIEAAALTIPAPAPEERALETEASVGAPIPAEWSPAEAESELPLAAESEDEGESEEEKGPFGRIPEWLEPRQDPHPFSPARWAAAREDADELPEPAVQTKPENLSNRLFEAYSRPMSESRPDAEVQPLFAQDTTESAETPVEGERLPAAERIAGAHLEDLSQVELLERLALAMEQERRRRAGSPGPDSTPPAAAPQAASDNTVESGGTITFPSSAPVESIDSDAPKSFTLPRLAPVTDTVAPFAAPLRPVPDSEPNEPEIAPAATTRIPAALRPVGFDAFGHDDADDALPGYIPPRHIGLAPTLQAPVAAEPIAEEDEQDEAEDAGKYAAFNTLSADFDYREAPEDDEEEAVLERGYSSLLNLTRQAPRQNFVRFDEPGAETIPSDAPEASSDEDAVHRPFDPPARPDPTETEKALRAALATLQRMSGAA